MSKFVNMLMLLVTLSPAPALAAGTYPVLSAYKEIGERLVGQTRTARTPVVRREKPQVRRAVQCV
jgi:hypothetical protein